MHDPNGNVVKFGGPFCLAAVALALVACCVGLSGCQSANASIVTEADRAAAAADLAYIAAAEAGPVWRPVDDLATPIDPAPVVTPSRVVPITVAIDDGGRPAIDVGILPTCSGGSCGSRDVADDDRRRPIREALAVTGRTVAAGGRVVQRSQPVRRVGGCLFRRNG